MVDDTTRRQLEQAAAHIKAGHKEEALDILVPLLHRQPDLVAGWWLAANAIDQEAKVRQILKRILKLRPGEPRARKKLAELEARTPSARRPVTGSLSPASPSTFATIVDHEPPARPESAPGKKETGLLRRVDPTQPILEDGGLQIEAQAAAAMRRLMRSAPEEKAAAPAAEADQDTADLPHRADPAQPTLEDVWLQTEAQAAAAMRRLPDAPRGAEADDPPAPRFSSDWAEAEMRFAPEADETAPPSMEQRKAAESRSSSAAAGPRISESFISVADVPRGRNAERRVRLDWKFGLAILLIVISLSSTAALIGLALRN